MASLREIKLRIRSIKSTQKITKAMEMVAASKMRRSQQQALKGRPYLNKLREIIENVIYYAEPPITHQFLKKARKVKNATYILLTSNRGLCGAFNSNVIKTILEILLQKNEQQELVITVGKKGRQAMQRIGKEVMADFENIPDKPSFTDSLGISKIIMEDFLKGNVEEVWLVYNHFHSTLIQKSVVKKLLPIEIEKPTEIEDIRKLEYLFEPERKKLLDELLVRYIETSIYQIMLESIASEHSARMMAMRKASDNAKEIVSNLTLHYNKARQAKITTQILEVVAGS